MLLLLVFHFKIWPKVLAWKIQTTFIRVLDYLNTNDYLNTILEVKSHWQYFYLVISDEFEPSWRLFSSARLGFENTAPADVCDIEPARLHWGAQNGRFSTLGSAGALRTAARARSAPLDLRRFTGQDHECLLRSTQKRTISCMVCTGPH